MNLAIPAALAVLSGVYFATKSPGAGAYDPTYADNTESDLIDQVNTVTDQITHIVTGSPADYFSTSPAMIERLKKREGLRLNRYRLGDGGYTIGYGRYYPDGGEPCPLTIDRATAEQWFVQDLQERGEKWVKLYVNVPLTQNQFDALVSMAYNLRPSSFKRIAQCVNAGQDPAPVAMQYTRPGTNLERGLIARREEELNIFYQA